MKRKVPHDGMLHLANAEIDAAIVPAEFILERGLWRRWIQWSATVRMLTRRVMVRVTELREAELLLRLFDIVAARSSPGSRISAPRDAALSLEKYTVLLAQVTQALVIAVHWSQGAHLRIVGQVVGVALIGDWGGVGGLLKVSLQLSW